MENKIISFTAVMLSVALLVSGCATKSPLDRPLPQFELRPEETYVLDTSKIPDIDPPTFIYLAKDSSGKYVVLDENSTIEPELVAIPANEIYKLEAMLEVKNMYIDIAREQEALINIERNKTQALKEILTLERESRMLERELRIDLEEAYRRERRDHRIDNLINRGTLIFTVIGAVAIAAL